MLKAIRSSLGNKRLDFGGQSTEYILAAVLALIIIGSLVLAVRHFFFSVPTPKEVTYHFKCTNPQCQHEFTIDSDDLPDDAIQPGQDLVAVDCEKCGGTKCAVEMSYCEHCQMYFLPQIREDGIYFVCPKCKMEVGS